MSPLRYRELTWLAQGHRALGVSDLGSWPLGCIALHSLGISCSSLFANCFVRTHLSLFLEGQRMSRARMGHRLRAILVYYIPKHSGFLKLSSNFSNNFRLKEIAKNRTKDSGMFFIHFPLMLSSLPSLLYNSISLCLFLFLNYHLQALFEFYQMFY